MPPILVLLSMEEGGPISYLLAKAGHLTTFNPERFFSIYDFNTNTDDAAEVAIALILCKIVAIVRSLIQSRVLTGLDSLDKNPHSTLVTSEVVYDVFITSLEAGL
ncbi:hypothetical protein HOY80DRAFT_1037553 [Tuber brumale]|nr:hypothetical protein HOY80DRAFT_1037553 [Tuber brumale]